MGYIFGNTDIAAERLKLLAEMFAPSTGELLSGLRSEAPRLVLDLGCGPGYTTRLLASMLRCGKTVGLDNSEHFVSLARKAESPGLSFYQHDVTSMPLPLAPADVIYLRFLLTHLHGPQDMVKLWASQLRVGGLLVAEETEWIHATSPAFEMYVTIVDKMLSAQGNMLYVGKCIGAMSGIEGLGQQLNRVARVAVKNNLAAKNFVLNMQSWKGRPFIRKNYEAGAITSLERDLRAIADAGGEKREIEWGIRQVVWERT